MSEMVCPMNGTECKKDGCAWWVLPEESCAIPVIAEVATVLVSEDDEPEEPEGVESGEEQEPEGIEKEDPKDMYPEDSGEGEE